MKFFEHLVFLREKNGILQKDIAKKLGISVHAYQRFEYREQEEGPLCVGECRLQGS